MHGIVLNDIKDKLENEDEPEDKPHHRLLTLGLPTTAWRAKEGDPKL